MAINLKDVRLHHWRKVLSNRKTQMDLELSIRYCTDEEKLRQLRMRAGRSKNKADFHLSCVQALNNVVPGTAERDLERHGTSK